MKQSPLLVRGGWQLDLDAVDLSVRGRQNDITHGAALSTAGAVDGRGKFVSEEERPGLSTRPAWQPIG
jgi:hypothetical protein